MYDEAVHRAGRVYHIVKLSSLHPELARSWLQLYLTLMHGSSPLTRAQREMLAVRVSTANRCHY